MFFLIPIFECLSIFYFKLMDPLLTYDPTRGPTQGLDVVIVVVVVHIIDIF